MSVGTTFYESDFRISDSEIDSLTKKDYFSNSTSLKNYIKASRLNSLIDRVHEIDMQISKLKFDLEADTAYIANAFLASINYPRFGGYHEFIRGVYSFADSNEDKRNFTFSQLMNEYLSRSLENESDIKLAEARLKDFIWLFFEGCGAFVPKYFIDLIKMGYVVGDSTYATWYDYVFNVLIPENGKPYEVTLRFFDIEQAMSSLDTDVFLNDEKFCKRESERGEYQAVRSCSFGKIEVTVRKKLLGTESNDPKVDTYHDGLLSTHTLGYRSFDPLEIAAWMNSLFNENSRELDILEEEEENGNDAAKH